MDSLESQAHKLYNSTIFRSVRNANEHTVLAACGIEGIQGENKVSLVSLATGTKCSTLKEIAQDTEGYILHDRHAEIVAKRGLVRYLTEMIKNVDTRDLYMNNSRIRFHLYTSQSPCGAASMHLFEHTVSRHLERDCDKTQVAMGRENSEDHEILRTKPGRADSPLTSCHSCSDKIGQWNLIGFQGCRLEKWMGFCKFSTLTVGHGFDINQLQMALIDRFRDEIELLGQKVVCEFKKAEEIFEIDNGKTSSLCANWIKGYGLEILNAEGWKQGAARDKKSGQFSPKCSSRLSRFNMTVLFYELDRVPFQETGKYKECKQMLHQKGKLLKNWKLK